MASKKQLVLIGVGGVMAATMLSACDNSDSTKDVMRKHYSSQAECMRDWKNSDDCRYIDNRPSGSASSGGVWYGPYYTRSGDIYHPNSGVSQGLVPSSPRNVEALTVRESSLGQGSPLNNVTPSMAARSESVAISRGGFSSSAEGHSSGG